MNEFNFATPTAEGEYRAKAAKIKMPTGNFKKNNKFNNKNNNQQVQAEPVQEQPQKSRLKLEPSAVVAEEVVKKKTTDVKQPQRVNKGGNKEVNRENDSITSQVEEITPVVGSTCCS